MLQILSLYTEIVTGQNQAYPSGLADVYCTTTIVKKMNVMLACPCTYATGLL